MHFGENIVFAFSAGLAGGMKHDPVIHRRARCVYSLDNLRSYGLTHGPAKMNLLQFASADCNKASHRFFSDREGQAVASRLVSAQPRGQHSA
jgi:hypothetical protein